MKVVLALLIALAGFFTSVAWAQERPSTEATAARQVQSGSPSKPAAAEAARAAKAAAAGRSHTEQRGVSGRSYQFPLKPYVQSGSNSARSPVICACVSVDGRA